MSANLGDKLKDNKTNFNLPFGAKIQIKMATKTTTIRMDEKQIESLSKDFGSFSTATQLILEPFDRLKKLTIQELKGYFTKEEITALVDSQNGTMLTPDFIYNKQFFVAQLEDFETFENGISRHGANSKVLIEKFSKLAHSQVYMLMLEIKSFWELGVSLDAFFEKMI